LSAFPAGILRSGRSAYGQIRSFDAIQFAV
jgi:hypothetical protein